MLNDGLLKDHMAAGPSMEVQEGVHYQPACLFLAICTFQGQVSAVCSVERVPGVIDCRKGCQWHVSYCRATVKPATRVAVHGQVAAAGRVCFRDAGQIDGLWAQDKDESDCVQAGHMTPQVSQAQQQTLTDSRDRSVSSCAECRMHNPCLARHKSKITAVSTEMGYYHTLFPFQRLLAAVLPDMAPNPAVLNIHPTLVRQGHPPAGVPLCYLVYSVHDQGASMCRWVG